MKEEVKNGIIISIVVILIIVVVYFSTAIFLTGEIGNKNKKENSKETTTIASESSYENKIIASSTFKQLQDEYMVMFLSNSEISENLKNSIKNYDSLSNGTKLYVVDMDEAINKFVKNENSNPSAKNIEELQIDKDTLIVIKNKTIDSYITDEDEIVDRLK